MRTKFKDQILKGRSTKLGLMTAFARVPVVGLKGILVPIASIEGDSIVYRDYDDLSVVVSRPKGLVTPVLRNTEGMGFLDIENGIAEEGA